MNLTQRSRDVLIAAGLGVAIGAVALLAAITLDPRFLDPRTGNDVWFEGDLGRVADEMTHRFAPHSRATVHPLFSLLTVAIAYALRFVGASPTVAVSCIVGLSAAVWAVACYVLFRALEVGPSDTLLLVLLCAASAAGQFWLTVPESAALGSASVMGALAIAVYALQRPVSDNWLVVASAGSLAITVTNWIAGIAGAFSVLPGRRAVAAITNGFAIVVALWAVQRAIVPDADFFVGYSNEERYLMRAEAGGVVNALRVVTMNGMLMPRLDVTEKPGRAPIMTVQRRGLGESSAIARVGTRLWAVLLAWGGLAAFARRRSVPGFRPVMVVLGCELALYAVYGTETFLYALNVVPLLVGVVAGGLAGAPRHLVRIGVVVLLIIALITNTTRLREARAYFTPAVAARIASMFAPTSVPSSAALR